MNRRFFTLALTGALCVSLLAGCGGTPEETPSPTPPAAETATPIPADTPAPPSPSPEETIEPEDTVKPEETDPSPTPVPDEPETTETPSSTPTPTPKLTAAPTPTPTPAPEPTPAPAPEPTPTPEPEPTSEPVGDPALTQAMWMDISAMELPSLMEVDDEVLSALYGIDSADLREYVCRVAMMNVHATEFFIARAAEGKIDTIKAAVESRQASLEETWSWYLPEQYELVQNYQLVVRGDYIFFAVSEHAAEAAAIFDNYFD